METILLPTTYFAPISYYASVLKSETIFIEQFEHFPKQTFRNRCSIYSPNGIQQLTVPLHERKDKTLTKDIKISYEINWQVLHWRSLESAYRSSPYFEFYEDDFRPYFEKKFNFLIDFNMEIMQEVLALIKIKKEFLFTSSYQKEFEGVDLRDSLNKKNVPVITLPRYQQVFEDRKGFISNLSIADLLFNQGNNARDYLKAVNGR